MKTLNMFKNWTLFEKIWLTVATIAILTVSLLLKDTLLGTIASISGILCVVMAAKGKIATFYFGIIQAGTYAYMSYQYGLYGEAMLNAFFFLPFQFIGWWVWYKNRNTQSTLGEDVYTKRLNLKQWLILAPIILVAVALYGWWLTELNAQQVRLDSFAVVLSIFAQFLMTFRYAEQWLMWIIINVLTITMWFLVLTQTGGNDWAIFIMWCAFLVNSVYGWMNWRKLAKTHQQEQQMEVVK